MSSNITRGYQAGLSSVCLMCTVPVVIKWISADPWVIGVMRLSVAVILMLFFMRSAREIFKLCGRDLLTCGVLGLTFALHWMTYFFSIKWSSATIAVVSTISFYGIFNSVLGAIFLSHRLRWFHGVGLAVCFVGTLLTAGEFETGSKALWGFIAGILSGFFFAVLPVIHQKSKHLNSNLRTFGQMSGALCFFAFTIPLGQWSLPSMDWVGLLYLGSIGTVGAHTLWVHATTELPTTAASIVYYLYIPLTAILSFLILGETLNMNQLVGAVLIIMGSLIGIFWREK